MERPPLGTPVKASQSQRTLLRSDSLASFSSQTPGARGSLASLSSQTPGARLGGGKYQTWNPRSASKGSSLLRVSSSVRADVERMSVGSSASAATLLSSSLGGSARAGGSGSGRGQAGASEAPSVCVMVRVRPLAGGAESCLEVLDAAPEEREGAPRVDVEASSGASPELVAPSKRASVRLGGEGGQVFSFDRVFREGEAQEVVFLDAGKPIADNALRGFNASILAYGQTGSGKTHTMQGGEGEVRGLLPRVLEYVFGGLERLRREHGITAVVQCSYLEIYKELVFDLLDGPSREESYAPGYAPASKSVREDVRKGVFVEGCVETRVESVREAFDAIARGAAIRHIASTSMNRESSRSHSVFTLMLEMKVPADETRGVLESTRYSRVNLVDLAGSERQNATKATGERLTEAKHINKSLSALGNVISALVEKSKGRRDVLMHVPYRDSTLTYLLKDSLGGNTKTSIIATVSPDALNFQESLSTLQFGQRAKRIKLSVRENTQTCSDVAVLRAEIERLREELRHQRRLVGGAHPVAATSRPDEASAEPLLGEKLEEDEEDETSSTGTVVATKPDGATVEAASTQAAALAANADFARLDSKVTAKAVKDAAKDKGANSTGSAAGPAPAPEQPEDVQTVLRKRLKHLERVLAELLLELAEGREATGALKQQARAGKELAEVLRDQVASKDLLLRLVEQKLKAYEEEGAATAFAANCEADLRELLKTEHELERQREIALLKAENAELAELYRLHRGEEDKDAAARRVASYQAQLEAVLDDKAELERLLGELSQENARLKQEQDVALNAPLSAAIAPEEQPAAVLAAAAAAEQQLRAEEQLRTARARIELLEEQLFAEAERATAALAGEEKLKQRRDRLREKETGSRRHSACEVMDKDAGDMAGLGAPVAARGSATGTGAIDVSSPSAPARAALLAVADAIKTARKRAGTPREQDTSLLESPSAASQIVAKRLLRQLADSRVQLSELRQTNRRLSVQLERNTSSAKKQKQMLRKSLSAKDADIDMEQVKALQLELELADMRDKFERVQANNKDLQDAVEIANSFSDFKDKQLKAALGELDQLKAIAAAKLPLTVLPVSSPLDGTSSSSSTPTAAAKENVHRGNTNTNNSAMRGSPAFIKSTPKPPRDSNTTVRMPTFEEGDSGHKRSGSGSGDPSTRSSVLSDATGRFSEGAERTSLSSAASYSSASVVSSASKAAAGLSATGSNNSICNNNGAGHAAATPPRRPANTVSVAEFFPTTDSVATHIAKAQAALALEGGDLPDADPAALRGASTRLSMISDVGPMAGPATAATPTRSAAAKSALALGGSTAGKKEAAREPKPATDSAIKRGSLRLKTMLGFSSTSRTSKG